MTQDDVLFGYRLQLFALAAERGVSQACRLMGVHRSTYYRWKAQVDRHGLELLRPPSGVRRFPTSSRCPSSSGLSRSRWGIPSTARGGSPLGWRARNGADWWSARTGSKRRSSGTG